VAVRGHCGCCCRMRLWQGNVSPNKRKGSAVIYDRVSTALPRARAPPPSRPAVLLSWAPTVSSPNGPAGWRRGRPWPPWWAPSCPSPPSSPLAVARLWRHPGLVGEGRAGAGFAQALCEPRGTAASAGAPRLPSAASPAASAERAGGAPDADARVRGAAATPAVDRRLQLRPRAARRSAGTGEPCDGQGAEHGDDAESPHEAEDHPAARGVAADSRVPVAPAIGRSPPPRCGSSR
jgi:hypothetical protein